MLLSPCGCPGWGSIWARAQGLLGHIKGHDYIKGLPKQLHYLGVGGQCSQRLRSEELEGSRGRSKRRARVGERDREQLNDSAKRGSQLPLASLSR